jgi:hypothetical protein
MQLTAILDNRKEIGSLSSSIEDIRSLLRKLANPVPEGGYNRCNISVGY